MKQVFLEKGKARLFDVPTPAVGPTSILVDVRYSFISSGTESATVAASGTTLFHKAIHNTQQSVAKVTQSIKENGLQGTLSLVKGSMTNLMPVGYSCSGKVIAVGNQVQQFRVGDYVACGGAGAAHHAEVISCPEKLAVLIKKESMLREASSTTIGAIALQGVRRAQIQLGDRVAVVGLGLLGQLTVQLARLSGAHVFGIDIEHDRMMRAQSYGAQAVYNPLDENWLKTIMFATEHHGVDTVIITAAGTTGELINQALQVTRRKGKVVLVGDVKLDFDREHLYAKEIDFLISSSYGPGRYDQSYEQEGHDYPYAYVRWTENRNMQLIVELIESGALDIRSLIQEEYAIESVDQAYEQLQKKQTLGIVLSYGQTSNITPRKRTALTTAVKPYKAPDGKLNVAVIGAGGFCKVKLMPIISSLKACQLHTIVDPVATNAINLARQYKVPHTAGSYEEVLHNPAIHAVVIATPHSLHAEQIIQCLTAGKAVFAEKPAAVDHDQLQELESFLTENHQSFFSVDFNRSHAPFIKQIKHLVTQRTTPLMVNYRMNVGHLSREHWSQSAKNRGRIIGEACHIFELFIFLTGAQPASVSVTPLEHSIDSIAVTDNFIATIRMKDGSVCTLVFTSTGSTDQAKEQMELFFDGKSIVMDDYKTIKGYGISALKHMMTKKADKGHEALIASFFKGAMSPTGSQPVAYERILITTKLSLIVHELVASGGGIRIIE